MSDDIIEDLRLADHVLITLLHEIQLDPSPDAVGRFLSESTDLHPEAVATVVNAIMLGAQTGGLPPLWLATCAGLIVGARIARAHADNERLAV